MKLTSTILLLISILSTGCASGINSVQKKELNLYKHKGYYVEEKNPALAGGLGILPGGGSFYTGEYTYGILNLLAWPLSILWDPFSGINSAESQNYSATKMHVKNLENKEVYKLDDQLLTGEISNKEYVLLKSRVTKKYSPIEE